MTIGKLSMLKFVATKRASNLARSGQQAGFTMLELVIAGTIMTVLLGAITSVVTGTLRGFPDQMAHATVRQTAGRTISRLGTPIMEASPATLSPVILVNSPTVSFQRVEGFVGTAPILSAVNTLSFSVDNGETLNGRDDDGDGIIDEGSVLHTIGGVPTIIATDVLGLTFTSNVIDTFIEITPLDANIDSDGFSDFGRAYFEGTNLTVTAPVTSDGRKFVRWSVGGVLQDLGVRTIEFAVAEDVMLKAYYQHESRVVPDRPREGGGDLD